MKQVCFFTRMMLAALFLLAPMSMHANELLVNNGTQTNSNVPVYGLYADAVQHTQFIQPASTLSAIPAGQTIYQLTFHLSSSAATAWTSVWEVRLMETELSSLTDIVELSDPTLVYTGTLDPTSEEMIVEFNAPFEYKGGNLMVDVRNQAAGIYKSASFYGITSTGSSYLSYVSYSGLTGSQQNFLPKMTISYGTPSNCDRPDMPTLVATAADGASFAWNGTAASYQYVVVAAGEEPDWSAAVSVSADSVTVTGLDPMTSYDFYLRSDCGEEQSASRKLTFTTDCVNITSFPWTEDFNALTSGIPYCWDNSEGTTTSASYKWSFYATGNTGACVRFNSYSNSNGNTNVLATPTLDLPAEPMQLAFYAKNPAAGDFKVMISTDGGATKTDLLTGLTGITAWDQYTVDLTPYANQSVIIYFQGTSNDGSGDAYIYLDDVMVREAPTCFPGGNIHIADADLTTATIAWTPYAGVSDYHLILKDGDEVVADTIVSDSTFVITGLTSSSNYAYTLIMYGYCDEQNSPDKAQVNLVFATDCEAIATLPWSEDFEKFEKGSSSSVAPQCWSLLNANDGTYPYIYINNSASYVHGGQKSLYFQSSNLRYGYAILPEFAMALDTCRISFWYKDESASSSGYLYVGYMTDIYDESTFVSLFEVERTTTMSYVRGSLAGIPADARVAFKYGGASKNYYLGIDDILIEPLPACDTPTSLKLAAYDQTTATFTWSAGGMETVWGVEVWNDSILIASEVVNDTAAFVLTDLESATAYDLTVKVMACQDSTLATVQSFAFTTLCGSLSIDELPLYYDFDSIETNTLPECWLAIKNGNYPYVSATNAYEGKSLYFNNAANLAPIAILPAMDADLNTLQVQFVYKNASSYASYGQLVLGTMSNPFDAASFVALDTLANELAYTEYEFNVANVPADHHYLAIMETKGNGYGAFVDNLYVRTKPNCLRPSNIKLDHVTDSTAVFAWTPQGAESEWLVKVYDMKDTVMLDSAYVSAAEYTLPNLHYNQAYNVTVGVWASCGEGELSDVRAAKFAFRTAAPAWFNTNMAVGDSLVVDFADATEAEKWILMGEDTENNHFVISDAHGEEKMDAMLYVTNNDTLSWHYTFASSSATIAERKLHFDTDSTEVAIHFQWQANGESSYDYGRAFLVADAELEIASHVAKVNGTSVSAYASTVPYNAADLAGRMNQTTAWQTVNDTLIVVAAGDYSLVFVWANDVSDGTDKPLGVHDVKVSVLAGVEVLHLNMPEFEHGFVDGVASQYYAGDSVVLTAIAEEHYHFVGWSNGETANPYSFVITADTTIAPIFAIDEFAVTLTAEDGSIQASAEDLAAVAYGTELTLTAVPAEHYHFVAWSNGEVANPFNLLVVCDTTITATFAIDTHTIILDQAEGGNAVSSLESMLNLDYGTEVTLTATPADGYVFVKWSNDELANPLTFTVSGDLTIAPVFEKLNGLNDLNAEGVQKVLIDGVIYIIREGVRYTVTGQIAE